MLQTQIRYRVQGAPGQPAWKAKADQSLINRPLPEATEARLDTTPLADLLKKQAREIMRSITECVPQQIPAQVARARDWEQVARLAIETGMLPEWECRLTGRQLICAASLADYRVAVELTCREHRMPAFVSRGMSDLSEVIDRLDTLAAYLMRKEGGAE